MLRHVQKCKLALCKDRPPPADFSWPQLPPLTAAHSAARLATTRGNGYTIYLENDTARDLSVTVRGTALRMGATISLSAGA